MKPDGKQDAPLAGSPPLAGKIADLPDAPGVYLMKNAAGAVIYVGKALSLKKRVRSYFSGGGSDSRPAARRLGEEAAAVEFIATANENEAFILENNLIKKLKPRYNIRLRDDKTFLSLRVDLGHPFPAVVPVRRMRKDGALYFGPYTSAQAIRSTLRFLRTTAPLRVCSDREFRNRTRPCIQYQIRRCLGPCCGLTTPEAYRAGLERVLGVLRGDVRSLRGDLEARMAAAAGRLDYEAAAILRDRLRDLERFSASQKVEAVRFDDADVVGFFREGGISEVAVLFFRKGKLAASSPFSFETDLDPEELLSQFVRRYYGAGRHVPREIFLPFPFEEAGGLSSFLAHRRGGPVTLKVPRRGDAVKLLAMAGDNARFSLRASQGVKRIAAAVAESLRRSLGLERAPLRIEGVDVSNTRGGEAVGAVVHFKEGEPLKSRYRRFRVKTAAGADDYAMMREVLLRRFRRGLAAGDLPDLVLVDGGAAHVAAAWRAAREAGVSSTAVAGMAKGDSRARAVADGGTSPGPEGSRKRSGKRGERRPPGRRADRVFLPGSAKPVSIPPGSDEMHLLQRIRDEAHRFAVSYHRNLRRKRSLASPLDSVRGLGPEKRKRVLAHFGGIRGLRGAAPGEIAGVEGIGPVLAGRIAAALRRRRE